jgi:hypothetical protein
MNDTKLKQSRGRNALVHGLYAKDVLLPWDSKDDFEKLHEDLKAEFSPRGRAEEEAVLDLAPTANRGQVSASACVRQPKTTRRY